MQPRKKLAFLSTAILTIMWLSTTSSFTSKSATRARSRSTIHKRAAMLFGPSKPFKSLPLQHGRRFRMLHSHSSVSNYRNFHPSTRRTTTTMPKSLWYDPMRTMSSSTFLESSVLLENEEQSSDQILSRQLEILKQKTAKLNKGLPINVNSPKQVSQAIFGTDEQSTKKEALRKAIENNELTPDQLEIAELVIQQREIASLLRSSYSSSNKKGLSRNGSNSGNLGQAASFSTAAVADAEEENVDTSTGNNKQNSDDDNQELTYDEFVDELCGSESQIDGFWREPLLRLTKPVTRGIVSQLHTECPMGFKPPGTNSPKPGTLLYWTRSQKILYPDCVVLTRVGEFYEAYGIDALLLMEHCNLNPMAGKAKAGCPYAHVQATLNGLVAQGFKVRVFEEANEPGWQAKTGIKQRFLAGTVTPASPTYLYNLVLSENEQAEISSPTPRPYVGIIHVASVYTYVEVSMEERTARVSEQLTAEAVACRLEAYPPADPLLYVPTPDEEKNSVSNRDLPFLPPRSNSSNEGFGSRSKLKKLKSWQVQERTTGISPRKQAKRAIVTEILNLIQPKDELESDEPIARLTADDFSETTTDDSSGGTHTKPLYKETAIQMGLLQDPTIPTLVTYLLPNSAPATCKRFLQRWLLVPPPPKVSDAMSTLVSYLKCQGPPLPPLVVPPRGQILSRLRVGQADVHVYRQILVSMDATIAILEMAEADQNKTEMIESLMTIIEYETNWRSDPKVLLEKCKNVKERMEKVILTDGEDRISISNKFVHERFLTENEKWRGSVKVSSAKDEYDKVYETARTLEDAVAEDFWCLTSTCEPTPKIPVVYDQYNNLVVLRDTNTLTGKNKDDYFHSKDRFGKTTKYYTTNRVQDALNSYLEACAAAQRKVANVLIELSEDICQEGHIPAVVQAAYANLILSTANNHAAKATTLGWHLAKAEESAGIAGKFQGVWPYWMEHDSSVENTFELDGIFLLTAPNMSGKSTLMRSVAAASLLTNCGLCAPVGPGSFVRRFDNIFLRGASADIPTEGKSAFGAEMQDIAAMQRSCGEKSLVFVDALGRGTSPKDGTCIAGAVLEEMATTGMSGVFATHLHDIFNLPLSRERIQNKKMAIHERTESGTEYPGYNWTYKLEDGECTDSMALLTAEHFGLPDKILERARHFQSLVPDTLMDDTERDNEDESEDSPPSTIESVNSDSSSTNTFNVITNYDAPTKTLDEAILHAQFVTRTNGAGGRIIIEAQYSAPAKLSEGQSCLYILELDTRPASFYVGETDKLQRRLNQHRSKKEDGWKKSRAYVLPVSDKSKARQFESKLIRKLSQAGFNLKSIADGNN